jgi:rare lipoprotein A (peptidoglycan hydrolase)
MYESRARSRRAQGKGRNVRTGTLVSSRPDRVALWAVFLALFAAVAAAASAQAQSGGTPPPGSTPAPAPTTTTSWTLVQKATWYGPGFWGRQTACGLVLTKATLGAAHRKLPCGTQVTFSHNGRSATATVIDRGPFRKGYKWDLTKRTAKVIGFLPVGSGPVTATVTPVAPTS